MSHDFHLLSIADAAEPTEQARAYLARMSEEAVLNPGSPDPVKEQRKQALAAALRTTNPQLEVFPFDYAAIARPAVYRGCRIPSWVALPIVLRTIR